MTEQSKEKVEIQRFLTTLIAHFFVLAIAGTLSVAQDFKQYPGSTLAAKASQQASAVGKGMEVRLHTTRDTFEKVYSVYKSLYKEVAVQFPKQTFPNGKEVKWAFFALDGGADSMCSNYWMKVQHPYVGTVDEEANFQDVRDVSVIQTVRRRVAALKRSRLLDISDREQKAAQQRITTPGRAA